MTGNSLPAPNLDAARERVVERLSTHYARDQLTLDELESRLERVCAARTTEALESVLVGLPAIDTASAPSTAVARSEVAGRSHLHGGHEWRRATRRLDSPEACQSRRVHGRSGAGSARSHH